MSSAKPTTTTSANLTFFVGPKDGSKAYAHTTADLKTGKREGNSSQEEREVIIENLRGKEHTVSLDTTGFQYYNEPAKHTTFANDEEIKREYYPETSELIKKLTGASRVVLFDHSTSESFLCPYLRPY